MIGWIVDQSNAKSGHIGKSGHPVQKLTSPPTALWAIIHIENQLFDMRKGLLSLIPPQLKSINHKVTGLVASAKKQERFTTDGLKYTARNKLFLGSHIMIPSLYGFDSTRLSAS